MLRRRVGTCEPNIFACYLTVSMLHCGIEWVFSLLRRPFLKRRLNLRCLLRPLIQVPCNRLGRRLAWHSILSLERNHIDSHPKRRRYLLILRLELLTQVLYCFHDQDVAMLRMQLSLRLILLRRTANLTMCRLIDRRRIQIVTKRLQSQSC